MATMYSTTRPLMPYTCKPRLITSNRALPLVFLRQTLRMSASLLLTSDQQCQADAATGTYTTLDASILTLFFSLSLSLSLSLKFIYPSHSLAVGAQANPTKLHEGATSMRLRSRRGNGGKGYRHPCSANESSQRQQESMCSARNPC